MNNILKTLGLLLLSAVFWGCMAEEEQPVIADDVQGQTDVQTLSDTELSHAADTDKTVEQDRDTAIQKEVERPDADGAVCAPGETTSCYRGPSGTKNVGICKAGTATCNESGTGWSDCAGQQLPQGEICGDGIDQNCDGADGMPGTIADYDGDGYTYCTGDCCEMTTECEFPATVHPSAYDFPDNHFDDNCNGIVDERESCDNSLPVNSPDGADAAAAIGLCLRTTEKKHGLITAEILFPSGKKESDPFEIKGLNGETISCPAKAVPLEQHAILEKFGAVIKPREGSSFFMLSTGIAADPIPDILAGKYGITTEFLCSRSTAPQDWYESNGNSFPQAPSCPDAQSGTNPINDPVMLELSAQAPENASAFAIDIYFLSREFPKYVCSPKGYNDFFVILLDSNYKVSDPTLQNPADKNLAMDAKKNPVGVNLANEGLFRVCCNENYAACKYEKLKTKDYCPLCTLGPAELEGTGMYLPESKFDDMYGATGWLTTKGNVQPGEVIKLRFAIWDTGDHIFDSQVIIDNFRWLPATTKPGTAIQE